MKTLLQCDFDATLTIGEVSHTLLEHFAEGNWKQVQRDYYGGRITVEDCNTRQFAMIKAGREILEDFLVNSGEVVLRPGFSELFDYAKKSGYDVSILSNGLEFYITTILKNLGLDDIEVVAAKSRFTGNGITLTYAGPDGTVMESGFKASWADAQQKRGYDRVYFLGDGAADAPPARRATHIFAVGTLLNICREENLACTPFEELFDVIDWLERHGEKIGS